MSNSMTSLSLFIFVCLICAPSDTNAFRSILQNTKWNTSNLSLTSTKNDDDNINDQESKDSITGTKNPLRLAVLKFGLTELRYTSPLNYEKREGSYKCASCNSVLFTSNGKYDSGSGWPSFWKSAKENSIAYKKEWDGRMEVKCKKCDGHLGHAFPDGPRRMDVQETDLEDIPKDDWKTSNESNAYSRLPRYCVNGASLRFFEE